MMTSSLKSAGVWRLPRCQATLFNRPGTADLIASTCSGLARTAIQVPQSHRSPSLSAIATDLGRSMSIGRPPSDSSRLRRRHLSSQSSSTDSDTSSAGQSPAAKCSIALSNPSEQEITLRQAQYFSGVAGQNVAVGTNFVRFRVHLYFRSSAVEQH